VAGSFTPAGARLHTARSGAAASGLPDGTVLIAGGTSDGTAAGALSSAEIYNPGLGTFSLLSGGLSTARTGATATLFNTGTAWRVLIAGGQNAGGALNSTEVYDPQGRTFTASGGSLSVGRAGHTATLLGNGTILMAGGSGQASAELYNPLSGTAVSTGSLTTDRTGHTATLLPDGNVLMAGGTSSGAAVNSTEIYNPAAGAFTAVGGVLGTARTGASATLLDSALVLVVGGKNGASGGLGSGEVYTPSFDPLGTVEVTSDDSSGTDAISGACTLTLTGTGATSCTVSVTPGHVDGGTHHLTGSYPGDSEVHAASTGAAALSVSKGTPTLSWATPAGITYGTALSGTQLNATASYGGNALSGTFTYTPGAGVVLSGGAGQDLHVDFAPADGGDYNGGSMDVAINVSAATLSAAIMLTTRPLRAKNPESARGQA